MLTDEQIKQALHARRVLPLGVLNPHGPLGLEQLAEGVLRLNGNQANRPCVERPIALPLETWQKLDELARTAREPHTHVPTASDLAAAILEQAVEGH